VRNRDFVNKGKMTTYGCRTSIRTTLQTTRDILQLTTPNTN